MTPLRITARRATCGRRLTTGVIASVGWAAAAVAQPAARGATDSLTLASALRLALALNPSLRSARLQVDAARGTLIVAASPFDTRVVTSALSGREQTLGFAPIGDAATTPVTAATAAVLAARQQSTTYQLALEQQLPFGMTASPQIGLSQVGTSGSPVAPTNRATAGLTVVVPLAKNRGGRLVTADRRAAQHDLDAADADLRHTVARTALQTTLAFLDYAAAGERRRVLRSSETRARLLVDETTELVRADARPQADLQQVRGNLASKRAQRAGAEQALAEARQQLGLLLGIPAEEIPRLPEAALDAPRDTTRDAATTRDATTRDGAALADSLDVRATRWATAAADVLAERPDVVAAASRRQAAAVELGAAENDLRPRLDLTVGVSYAGLERGPGLDAFFAPLYRTMRGTSMSVQLQYGFPLRNLGARGRAASANALLEQARTAERDLARQATASAAVAAAGVQRASAALTDAADAVRLARLVVDNEREKFRLGVATQIDVVLAEDGLMNALLAEIAARRTYAGAVGTLRFQDGDLARAGDDVDRLARLLQTTHTTTPSDSAATPATPVRRDP